MNDWLTYTEPSRKVCDLMKNAVGMQSIGRLINIAYWVMQTAEIPGEVVEMGVHEGRTAALIASLTKKQVWLYDSFQGLQGPTKEDGVAEDHPYYKQGAMKASAETCLNLFGEYGLKMPFIIPEWFLALNDRDMPGKIAFAHLDGDLYQSVLPCLKLVWPRLSVGGVCIVDDVRHDELRGATCAFNEFFREQSNWLSETAWEPNGQRAIHSIVRKL